MRNASHFRSKRLRDFQRGIASVDFQGGIGRPQSHPQNRQNFHHDIFRPSLSSPLAPELHHSKAAKGNRMEIWFMNQHCTGASRLRLATGVSRVTCNVTSVSGVTVLLHLMMVCRQVCGRLRLVTGVFAEEPKRANDYGIISTFIGLTYPSGRFNSIGLLIFLSRICFTCFCVIHKA